MDRLKDLKSASSLQDVATLLRFKPKALSYILYRQSSITKYKQFKINKRSGGQRTINAPERKRL
jgi:hypothetical protein